MTSYAFCIGQKVSGTRTKIGLAETRPVARLLESKKILFIVLSMAMAGLCSCGGGSSGPSGPNPAYTGACAALPATSDPTFNDRLTAFVVNSCYAQQQWQHDSNVRTSDGVHFPFIQIFYSPSLYNWMNVPSRQGPPPDGSIIVKEEHQTQTSGVQFRSVMVRDSTLWWDGWFWEVIGNESASGAVAPTPAPGCSEAVFPSYGAGLTCLNCHSSAVANFPGTSTYSSTAYINGAPGSASAATTIPDDAIHGAIEAHRGITSQSQADPDLSGFTGRLPSSIFANVQVVSATDIPCMVPESMDDVPSKPSSVGGPSLFITSDQCAGCHDANDLVTFPANMLYTEPKTTNLVNLSQRGEWRYSMMGLAGRDPIFFAQLDTESTVHGNIKGQSNSPGFVQDFCLRCHGVMGQRQYHLDKGNAPGTLFTRDQLNDATSPYAALARDGVSCTVCHHIANEGLDSPSTYAGLFNTGPANQLYGPYPSGNSPVKVGDNVVPQPMINALGTTPVYGVQMTQANLCESCHTIPLPVYDANGNQVGTEFEQTTYFEWLNSSFSGKPCQSCHMAQTYKGAALQFKVANIEDSTFPRFPGEGGGYYPAGSTTLPKDQLTVQTRTSYPRHTLNGINLFALEMFDQFRTDLGLYQYDSWLPLQASLNTSSQKTAVYEGVTMAQTATAYVSIQSATINDAGQLDVSVLVQNLAGHNFPSGVSFRRAFLDFQVLDGSEKILWESGGTNNEGVITDTAGNPLTTEFFSSTQQLIQPHFWTDNPITRDDEVQIYEEMIKDPQGQLTTSFLSLANKIKDNRIQPAGRSATGPNADITAPVGTNVGDDYDPNYQNGCGCSVVRYLIPLTGKLVGASQVQATLYYQSIPPYYLRQRGEDANGPDTQRLINYTEQLNVATKYTEIANWKLKIASAVPVAITSGVETSQKRKHPIYSARPVAAHDVSADSRFDQHDETLWSGADRKTVDLGLSAIEAPSLATRVAAGQSPGRE